MQTRVLVVDDEKSIASAVAYALGREGYEVQTAQDGEEALAKVESFRPRVVVLDVMMPKLNGYEVCRRLDGREDIGIILLTVKNDIVDKVVGLELGADDYMTKPFEIRELLARVKALARRLERIPEAAQEAAAEGGLRVLPERRAAYADGRQLDLTPKEFDLLAALLHHPERVYTREELLDLVWGMDYAGGTRTVDIHIQRLRKKLGEPWQAALQTVYGIGYKASPSAAGGSD
ncbi:response regulator transcription factor [Paenibacillus pasadenensis]|uniref:Alkaline phosphatase synthesis transcriptional regulatory protein PhoP n=1 Tax=Paenibacillus pasadenensis TaxID=217090 RepID=A0A2N5N0K9_9BACL|nr:MULTISPECIES: response regulator transcription factor [Paenibacillus]PLT43862.1 Alkaline phosphatase synthesis transcriptional regulatory protein PhoP [Paenibacillus pasadenensis]QGG54457.1 response regulator [Paenibacillus sp. B01]